MHLGEMFNFDPLRYCFCCGGFGACLVYSVAIFAARWAACAYGVVGFVGH